jgi:protein TonB
VKKPVPLVTGITLGSTIKGGAGPAIQVGNTQMGEVGRKAVAPVTEKATPVEPEPPAKPPVRRKAKLKKRVKPKYPKAALRAGIEGTIVFLLTIGPDGRVKKVKAIGKPLGYGLDGAAKKAVAKWLYRPETLDGKPVTIVKRVKVEFVLED